MWKDEILEEIYRIREEHAKYFNYDIKAICNDLRQRQTASGRTIVLHPLKPRRKSNSPIHPTV
ncbi:MAG: hypothetical protein SW833_00265 [Cyanobacteriota bacterium]|nr:hypothetical protein [Cyanobacteriota bacterium]